MAFAFVIVYHFIKVIRSCLNGDHLWANAQYAHGKINEKLYVYLPFFLPSLALLGAGGGCWSRKTRTRVCARVLPQFSLSDVKSPADF